MRVFVSKQIFVKWVRLWSIDQNMEFSLFLKHWRNHYNRKISEYMYLNSMIKNAYIDWHISIIYRTIQAFFIDHLSSYFIDFTNSQQIEWVSSVFLHYKATIQVIFTIMMGHGFERCVQAYSEWKCTWSILITKGVKL